MAPRKYVNKNLRESGKNPGTNWQTIKKIESTGRLKMQVNVMQENTSIASTLHGLDRGQYWKDLRLQSDVKEPFKTSDQQNINMFLNVLLAETQTILSCGTENILDNLKMFVDKCSQKTFWKNQIYKLRPKSSKDTLKKKMLALYSLSGRKALYYLAVETLEKVNISEENLEGMLNYSNKVCQKRIDGKKTPKNIPESKPTDEPTKEPYKRNLQYTAEPSVIKPFKIPKDGLTSDRTTVRNLPDVQNPFMSSPNGRMTRRSAKNAENNLIQNGEKTVFQENDEKTLSGCTNQTTIQNTYAMKLVTIDNDFISFLDSTLLHDMLKPETWLTMDHIDFILAFLSKKQKNIDGKITVSPCSYVYFNDETEHWILLRDSELYGNYDVINSDTGKAQNHIHPLLVSDHFMLLFFNCHTRNCIIFDSKSFDKSESQKDDFKQCIKEKVFPAFFASTELAESWNVEYYSNMPEQNDDCTCGLYLLNVANQLLLRGFSDLNLDTVKSEDERFKWVKTLLEEAGTEDGKRLLAKASSSGNILIDLIAEDADKAEKARDRRNKMHKAKNK